MCFLLASFESLYVSTRDVLSESVRPRPRSYIYIAVYISLVEPIQFPMGYASDRPRSRDEIKLCGSRSAKFEADAWVKPRSRDLARRAQP